MFFPTKNHFVIPAILLIVNGCSNSNENAAGASGPRLIVPVQPVRPGDCISEISISGLVKPATDKVVFSKSGILEKGQESLKAGMTFTEGQLLCQINNKEAYRELTSIKNELIDALTDLMPEIKRTLPYKAIDKWKAFIEALKPVALLPDYPSTNLPEEKDIPQLQQLESTYKKAERIENGMKNYFYVTPFAGTVSTVYVNEGDNIKADAVVAEIVSSGTMQLEVTLTKDQAQQVRKGKAYQLVNKSGRPAGSATLGSSTVNKDGTVKCTFNIQAAKGGQLMAGTNLNIQLKEKGDKPCVIVDADQICHDAVQVVSNGKIETRPVKVLSRDGKRVYVAGLTADQAILVDAYENAPQNIRFVAAKK